MEMIKQFTELLHSIRKSMMWERILQQLSWLFLWLGGIFFLLSLIASIMVIPYLMKIFILTFVICIVIFFIRIWVLRPKEKEAVLLFNKYVKEDLAITGYEFLHKEGMVEQLVVQQALKEMEKKQSNVLKRKKVYLYPKLVIVGTLFICISVILHLFPSPTMEAGKLKEKEWDVIAKTEKEIKKEAKKEKNQQVQKQLEKLAKKVGEKETVEKAFAEIEKKAKELELQKRKLVEKTNELEKKKDTLNQNGLKSLATALSEKDPLALKKELTDVNKQYNQMTKEQKQAFNQLTGMNKQLSRDEIEQLMKQMEDMLKNEEILNQIQSLQTNLAQAQQELKKESLANGISPPSSNSIASNTNTQVENPSSSNSNDETSEKGTEASNPDKSNGDASGSGSGNGSGNGNGSVQGNGTGSGQGNGTGSGSGKGNGQGNGSGGSGAGLGSGSRELLTIPEKVNGKQNQEVDTGKLGEGKQGELQEGEGPVLKGSITPYEQVFSKYEKAYRESTARYNLPQDLENIVKNYFTDIKPNEK